MNKYKKTSCRYCDSPLGDPFLDLGFSPLANNLPFAQEKGVDEFKCPLRLVYCPNCHLVQLSHVVPAELMFDHYLYVSSTTKTFQDHFAGYAHDLKVRFAKNLCATNREMSSPKSSIGDLDSRLKHACLAGGRAEMTQPLAVDIGSNDGLLVSCYIKEGMRGVGVEPANNLAQEARKKGIPTVHRYFDAAAVDEILKEYGQAGIVSANNVFAHIDDVQSVLKNVGRLLRDDGIFVIEFPYLVTMLEKMYFDMVYHEHLSYIGVTALDYFTKRFGFRIFDIQEVASHGGSLRVFIQKENGPYEAEEIVSGLMARERETGCLSEKPYVEFAARVAQVKHELLSCVKRFKSEGRRIAGYGAPAKATTIINYCGLTDREIDYVVDDNPLKQGRLVPGAQISIVSSEHLEAHPVDYLIIFAWNFAEEIIRKLMPLQEKGTQFLVPLPSPKVTGFKSTSSSSDA